LAADGRKFTNFHVAQPVCSASRTALLTGCYPNRLGIHGALGPSAKHGIHADEMTLAELVKHKGYAIAAVGKWHLVTDYTTRGVKFIEKNKDKPFFLYLAQSMVHVPLFVSEKFKDKSGKGLFGDVMMKVNWSVGQIMESLKENGVEKNTWVILTSDNGPWLSYGDHADSAGPLREGKGTC
jgi:arylsulfatase